jgi:hypothetical protein
MCNQILRHLGRDKKVMFGYVEVSPRVIQKLLIVWFKNYSQVVCHFSAMCFNPPAWSCFQDQKCISIRNNVKLRLEGRQRHHLATFFCNGKNDFDPVRIFPPKASFNFSSCFIFYPSNLELNLIGFGMNFFFKGEY